jgi:hypothetical protein
LNSTGLLDFGARSVRRFNADISGCRGQAGRIAARQDDMRPRLPQARSSIGERIRDKFAASRKKGMWMGGYGGQPIPAAKRPASRFSRL